MVVLAAAKFSAAVFDRQYRRLRPRRLGSSVGLRRANGRIRGVE